MASFDQLPGRLGISFRRGDAVNVEVDFNPTSFSGQTVTASIHSAISGATVQPMNATMIDASQGRLILSLTSQQSSSLPAGTYSWLLSATDGTSTRTYLTGFVEVER